MARYLTHELFPQSLRNPIKVGLVGGVGFLFLCCLYLFEKSIERCEDAREL